MLSSDLVDPDLLSVSRRTANLVPAVANHTVKRHSLITAPCSSPDNVQHSVSDAILMGVSPIPGRLASSLLLAVLGFCRVTSPHTTSCRH